VQAEEFSNQRLWVSLDVVVIILQDIPQKFVLSVTDGLEHVLAVSSVVKERAALALTGQRSHGVHLTHHQRCHQPVWTNAADIVFVVNLEYFADVVKGIRRIIRERIDG
jgi:hypothetical protein